MVFTLLTFTSSFAFLASAVVAAKHANATLVGYLLAIIVGALLALANAWLIGKLGDFLGGFSGSWSKTQDEWAGHGFVAVLALWTLLSVFLGGLVASAALRFMA